MKRQITKKRLEKEVVEKQKVGRKKSIKAYEERKKMKSEKGE